MAELTGLHVTSRAGARERCQLPGDCLGMLPIVNLDGEARTGAQPGNPKDYLEGEVVALLPPQSPGEPDIDPWSRLLIGRDEHVVGHIVSRQRTVFAGMLKNTLKHLREAGAGGIDDDLLRRRDGAHPLHRIPEIRKLAFELRAIRIERPSHVWAMEDEEDRWPPCRRNAFEPEGRTEHVAFRGIGNHHIVVGGDAVALERGTGLRELLRERDEIR